MMDLAVGLWPPTAAVVGVAWVTRTTPKIPPLVPRVSHRTIIIIIRRRHHPTTITYRRVYRMRSPNMVPTTLPRSEPRAS
uniref:Putative secreted protein n=1 Tax=Anopheles triannulatus TaxID=58253 RepID=A0A2M4B5D4_9DIPT